MEKETDKYKHFNHHHEMTEEQELVDFGTGQFVADKKMIPLLEAMNDIGLVTLSHCQGHNSSYAFVKIKMKDVTLNVCKEELVIGFKRKEL